MEVHDPERYRALSTAAGFNLPVFKPSLISAFRSWAVSLLFSPIFKYVKEIWRWLSLSKLYNFRKQFIVFGLSGSLALQAGFKNQTHGSSLTLGVQQNPSKKVFKYFTLRKEAAHHEDLPRTIPAPTIAVLG